MRALAQSTKHHPMDAKSTKAGAGKLGWLEAGRAVAAIAVVVHHAEATVRSVSGESGPLVFQVAERGVDFFFVLSGFIILVAHWDDIGVHGRYSVFLKKRIIRLIPALWIIAGSYLVLLAFLTSHSVSVGKVASTLLLLPVIIPPAPIAVWSLHHEALFYVLFSIVVASPRLGSVVAVGLLAASVVQLFFQPADAGPTSLVLSAFNFQFLVGGIAGWLYVRRVHLSPSPMIAVGTVAVLVILLWTVVFDVVKYSALDYISPARTWVVVALAVPLGMVVYGLARLSETTSTPRILVLLGAASYSIYLIHIPAMSITRDLLGLFISRHILGSPFALIVFAMAGVLAGVAFHLIIEKPVLVYLRSRFLSRPIIGRVPLPYKVEKSV